MELITRKTIRQKIGLDEGWLTTKGSTSGAGSTSSIVDINLYSSVRDQYVRTRDVVAIVEGSQLGERRLVTSNPTAAGVVGVSPVFGGSIGSGIDYEIWKGDGPHPDKVDQFIDRALDELCWRWLPRPLSYLLDPGDGEIDLTLSGSNWKDPAGTTLWVIANATPLQVDMNIPYEFARRHYRITASGADGSITGPQIPVDPKNPSWRIRVFMKSELIALDDIGGDARFVLYDDTNNVEFDPATSPFRSTTFGWELYESDFTIPPTCESLQVRFLVPTSGGIGDFIHLQVWPKNATRWSLPRSVRSKKHVGPVFRMEGTTFGELKPADYRGTIERREVAGRGVELRLDAPGNASYWFYERVPHSILTSDPPASGDDAQVTWAEMEWVVAGAKFYLYEYLNKRDRLTAPDRWKQLIYEARSDLELAQLDHGAEPMHTEDSRHSRRRVFRRV